MSLEMNSDRAICTRCGRAYGRRKGNFSVSYALNYKGSGYLPICKSCVEQMYNSYLAECNNPKDAVRRFCRNLNIYWAENVFNVAMSKATTRTVMVQYLQKINALTYAGKSYDDTLAAEGTLWAFGPQKQEVVEQVVEPEKAEQEEPEEDQYVPTDEVIEFWGPGYTPEMYKDMEQRKSYWLTRLPNNGVDIDIGTEAIIRQICQLELDINRDRAAGRTVEKSMSTLSSLLGSANLKPAQKGKESLDKVPFGVGIAWCEQYEPIPEPRDEFKDVDGIIKYVLVWLYGHLGKMMGKKNLYSKLYEAEMNKLRVERPEFAGDDDEELINDVFSDEEQLGDDEDVDINELLGV